MLSRVISGFTHVCAKPENWEKQEHGECLDLHVRIANADSKDGLVICESAWEPTSEELALLNQGGSVILRAFGGQPPVALYVELVSSEGSEG